MTKQSKIPLLIIVAVVIFVAIFIFSNSLDGPAASAEKSKRFVEMLVKLFGDKVPPHAVVRKLAHLAEYAMLGMALMGLSVILRLKPAVPLVIGVLSAIADEAIQIFTGRNSSAVDVWIDFAGVFLGAVVIIGIRCLVKAVRKTDK